MRYHISTDSTTEERNGNTYKVITTHKTPYVTVGDIVGALSTAGNAVSKLKSKKGDPNLAKTAAGSLVGPLAALVKTTDAYKKTMKVINIVTPIVKMVARASGIAYSPGNAADIAKIVLSEVKKILIQIAISALVALKQMIWSIEIPFPAIDSSVSSIITSAIKVNSAAYKASVDKVLSSLSTSSSQTVTTVDGTSYTVKENDDVASLKSLTSSEEEENYIAEVANNATSDGNYTTVVPYSTSSSHTFMFIYKTSYSTGNTDEYGNSIKRLIAGSYSNEGLFYSDDDGKTWTSSNITTGNWKCCDGYSGNYDAGSFGNFEEASSPFDYTKVYYFKKGDAYYVASPSALGLYELCSDSSFSEAYDYYTGSSSSFEKATPVSLSLNEAEPCSDASFSSEKTYYSMSSNAFTKATPLTLSLYDSDGNRITSDTFEDGKAYYNASHVSVSPASAELFNIEESSSYSFSGNTIYTDSNLSVASPSGESLYIESADSAFIQGKNYCKDSTDAAATPELLELYIIDETGKGIVHTSDYGITYAYTNKTAGSCAAIYYTGTRLLMASASNEGLWYSDNYSVWNVSNISTGNYNGFAERTIINNFIIKKSYVFVISGGAEAEIIRH